MPKIVVIDDELKHLIEESSSSYACTCCDQDRFKIRHVNSRRLNKKDKSHEGRGDEDQRDEAEKDKIEIVEQRKHNRKDVKAQDQKPKSPPDGDNTFLYNIVCFKAFIEFLRPFDLRSKQKKQQPKVVRGLKGSEIPSVIVLERRQICGKDEDYVHDSLSQQSNRKDRILQKVEDLKAMIEEDLRNRTNLTDTTISDDSSHHNNYVKKEDHRDAITLSDDSEYSNSDCYPNSPIARTISSISFPFFPDAENSLDLDTSNYDDALQILDLKYSGKEETEDDCIAIISKTRESKDETSVGERDADEELDYQMLKEFKDSFISYEDICSTSLDLADGVSYDHESDISTHLENLNESDEGKALLDDLCLESVQTKSVASIEY